MTAAGLSRNQWVRRCWPAPFDTVYGATYALVLPFVFGTFGTSAFSFAFSTTVTSSARNALLRRP